MDEDLTPQQRTRAVLTLREVIALIDAKQLDASSAQRAFLAGAASVLS